MRSEPRRRRGSKRAQDFNYDHDSSVTATASAAQVGVESTDCRTARRIRSGEFGAVIFGGRWRGDAGGSSGQLRVEQQLLATRGGASIALPKTKRSNRTIALNPETVEALKEHREAQLLERALTGDAYIDAALVSIYLNRLSEAFLPDRNAAGLSTGSMHILRHTWATLALAGKRLDLKTFAARLGDREETVLRVYSHLLPSSDADAAKQVAGMIAREHVARR